MRKWVGEAWSKVGKMKDQEVWLISGIKWKWEPWSQHWGFVQDDEYVLDNDDEPEKEDEDKGNAENEEVFILTLILIHYDLPIVIEWYSLKIE